MICNHYFIAISSVSAIMQVTTKAQYELSIERENPHCQTQNSRCSSVTCIVTPLFRKLKGFCGPGDQNPQKNQSYLYHISRLLFKKKLLKNYTSAYPAKLRENT